MFKTKVLLAGVVGALLVAGAIGGWALWPKDKGPEAPHKNFRDVAAESGIAFHMRFLNSEQGETFKVNLYDHGSGLAIGDYDGDGHDDVYFVNQLGPNALYRNKGDGTFADVTEQAGVALGDRICTSATFVDYANEGRQSLFVTSTRGGNVLFRNMGDGTFKDVTKQAGLEHVGHSQACIFFDFDNDGHLDILLLNTAAWTTNPFDEASQYFPGKGSLVRLADSPVEHNILYRNNGDGTFTDVTAKSGLKGKGWSADAVVFDYNDDGHLDVLITRMFGPSQLFRNNGDSTFTEVTKEVLGRTPAGGMGEGFDFDNDGKLDLYIVDMHSDMWVRVGIDDLSKIDEKKKYRYMWVPDYREKEAQPMALEKKMASLLKLRYDEVLFGNTFHRNLGKGKFKEMSDQANLETLWPWGIATGDFDNDGYEDVFLPSGMGYPWGYWPNRLLMNNGNRTFRERSHEEGIEPPASGPLLDGTIRGKPMPRSSRAAAVADFDGDGRLEIMVNNFNDRPYYFKNNFPRKNYVAFRLRGTKSNRDAIGAVVRLHVGGQVLTRQVNPASGYLTQSSKTLHFGLGDHTQIDKVEITWPRSRVPQVLKAPGINALHSIVEPAS